MAKQSSKDRALTALLEHNSIRDAAKACRLSEATIYRYLQDDEFTRDYRDARRRTVETAIGKLQIATNTAVETLIRNLHCENPAVEVRTAQIIYENSLKGVELLDVIERLERLEYEHERQNRKA